MVLALKYRPKKFEEIIGQEAIITTLKNSLDTKRIAHAYLFSGLRGSGKTTTA
jgi:DNA polymerase-3 subunit gamma/tau